MENREAREGRSMSEAQLAVCVVGAGRAGMVHARNYRWNLPRARLTAIVEPDAGTAAAAVGELSLPGDVVFGSLSEALERATIDAVVVTTPTFTHAELVTLAAGAGRHVLCEKPLALTLEECDRIEGAVAEAGVVFEMGFMRRFDPPFVAAERLLREGRIGRPTMIRSLTRGPGLPPPWAQDPRTSNGMLAEVNSHDFDTVRWLMGAEIVSVFARAAALKVPELREQHPDFYDSAAVVLELSSGALAVIEGVCPASYGYDARAEVVGTEGVLAVGGLDGVAVTSVRADSGVQRPTFPSWRDRFQAAYADEDRHFVRRILEGGEPKTGPLDGRRALEGVLAANQAIRTGQAVSLPL
jgi:myo-inositol 2-dehydrogenase/D-chiro-inositol 1-dehydrogenase/scyllo-inositol 2-dehydrogenase (NAD+)